MLTFQINATSIQESNLFLRKLWSELNQIHPLGWNMYSYREGNKITIGTSTLGEISFDYKQRGCIKNLYIDNKQDAEGVSVAVQRAKENSMKTFSVSFELENKTGIYISDVSFGGCKVFTHGGKVFLCCNFEAYSAWDAERFLPNKYASILSVFYEYTNILFDIVKTEIAEGSLDIKDTVMREYNYRWIDLDECPQSERAYVILPHECLQLISYIMDDICYDEDVELLLNSSRVLLTTKRMLEEIDFPYSSWKADVINSMVCSSLEPLSLILDKSNERCDKCGNMVFSINKKIKKMCTRYFGEGFAKYVGAVIYKNRSAFLHMGQPESTQQPSKIFYPQINESSGMVMMPHGMVRDNVFDYSSFLFRNIAHDYFGGTL